MPFDRSYGTDYVCKVFLLQYVQVNPVFTLGLIQEVSTSCLHCSESMDLSALRQQILTSTKIAREKAEIFLLKSQVNDLSKDEWRELIASIPEDVEKEIGR